MIELELVRFANTPFGTFGKMTNVINGSRFFSVEQPWNNNIPFKSCIPCDTYTIKYGYFNKDDYAVYVIQNVIGRTDCKIHVANTYLDVEGCVGFGLTLGWDNKRNIPMVVSSGDAFKSFMNYMNKIDEAQLTIKWADERLMNAIF